MLVPIKEGPILPPPAPPPADPELKVRPTLLSFLPIIHECSMLNNSFLPLSLSFTDQNVIDKLAEFVVRNGFEFEEKVKASKVY